MSDPATAYQFFSWHRTGIAGMIATPDGSKIAPTALLTVTLELNGAALSPMQVALLGPGEARGFDARQIVRTVPEAGASQFESNLFPAVEFARPDFPWIVTPAAATADRLRPWLVLAVVEQRKGVTFAPQPSSDGQGSVLVLTIRDPARPGVELPDLATSWAWAHAQAIGPDGVPLTLGDLATSDPGRVRSRLLCARPLAPNTTYTACVVPAFAIGCKRALGLPITDGDRSTLQPAWTGSETTIQLPVLFSWSFATGSAGDFRSLARQLAPHALSAGTGIRAIDLTRAGFGLPGAPAAPMPGVLLPLGDAPPSWGGAQAAAFRAALGSVLAHRGTTSAPLLAPPTYGGIVADATATTAGAPTWLINLNLDPRYRAFAGAGARVVERQQESLLAEAWRQLGDAQSANRVVHIAQLTRGALATVVKRRIAPLAFDERLGLTSPLHARVKLPASAEGPAKTVAESLKTAPVPRPLNAALRRATRARGLRLTVTTAQLPRVMHNHALTTLHDGRVLLIPPKTNKTLPDTTAALFDPIANAWTDAGTVLFCGNAVAITLSDGRVFAFGGDEPAAMIFDPSSGWRSTSQPPNGGTSTSLAELPDGRILVCGYGKVIYDPARDLWQHAHPVGTPTTTDQDPYWQLARFFCTMTALDDGRVLLAGGSVGWGPPASGTGAWASALLFDPSNDTWSGTGNMLQPRESHAAVKLRDGRVLVFGGMDTSAGIFFASAEIYDPKSGTWSKAAPLGSARTRPNALLLSDGTVIRVGGEVPNVSGPPPGSDPTETYDPLLDRWRPGPTTSFGTGDGNVGAARLLDDRVLVASRWRTSCDLIVPIPLSQFVAQPISITDYFKVPTPTASERGRLTWPPATLLTGTDPVSDALRQQITNSTASTIPPTPTWDDGLRGSYDAALTATMDTNTTIPRHVATRLPVPAGHDPMQPIVSGPDFAQAMFDGLRDQGRDYILPGLSGVPQNTLALLQVEPNAIEAYLVGLNEALGRMLRWRGYPTDRRGTAFRQFWDTGTPLPPDQRDIPPLTAWGTSSLGSHLRARGGLVLLVRSPLLQRYPDTAVSAVEAAWLDGKHALGTSEKKPVYRATVPPDVTFFAFDLVPTEAFGDPDPAKQRPGWFFVFAQHPTAPEFGVDVGATPPNPAGDATTSAAQLASATLRRPTRVAIHASGLHVVPTAPAARGTA